MRCDVGNLFVIHEPRAVLLNSKNVVRIVSFAIVCNWLITNTILAKTHVARTDKRSWKSCRFIGQTQANYTFMSREVNHFIELAILVPVTVSHRTK